jgi:polyisoprenoid-binding protein YceI
MPRVVPRPLAPLLAGLLGLGAARAAPAEPGTQTYVVDPAGSRVRVELGRAGLMKFLGHEHHIEVRPASGRVLVVADDPARSSVVLRFESAGLAVVPGSEPAQDIPKVEERMRGPEVLDVARHPEIVFASDSVRALGGDASRQRLLVAGTLTLRGRALPVEIPLEVVRTGDAILARGEARLELRALGIEPPSVAGVVKVANRFKLALEIRALAAP